MPATTRSAASANNAYSSLSFHISQLLGVVRGLRFVPSGLGSLTEPDVRLKRRVEPLLQPLNETPPSAPLVLGAPPALRGVLPSPDDLPDGHSALRVVQPDRFVGVERALVDQVHRRSEEHTSELQSQSNL